MLTCWHQRTFLQCWLFTKLCIHILKTSVLVVFTIPSRSLHPFFLALKSLALKLRLSLKGRSVHVRASRSSCNWLIRATSPLSPAIVDYFMSHKVNIDGMETLFGGSRSIHRNVAWVVLTHCVCEFPITLSQGVPVAFYLYTGFRSSYFCRQF